MRPSFLVERPFLTGWAGGGCAGSAVAISILVSSAKAAKRANFGFASTVASGKLASACECHLKDLVHSQNFL